MTPVKWQVEAHWHLPLGFLFGVSWDHHSAVDSFRRKATWDVVLHLGPGFVSVGRW